MKKIVLAILLTTTLIISGCSSNSEKAQTNTSTTSNPADQSTSADKECNEPALDLSKTYNVVFETSKGSFTVQLDTKNSPKGAAHLAALVKQGFYDGLTFHRVVPDFVIQGGDPLGNGTGSSDCFVITEEPSRPYKQGDFAWAKSQMAPAGHAASQFFIVTGADDSPSVKFLGSKQQNADGTTKIQYGSAGTVIKGLDVAISIEKLATAPDGPPSEKVTINSAKLES